MPLEMVAFDKNKRRCFLGNHHFDVTGSFLSLQKATLIDFTAPSFISLGSSHHLSDVGFLFVTFFFTQSCDALVIGRAPCLPYSIEALGEISESGLGWF